MITRTPWIILAIILLAGSILRSLYLAEVVSKPDFAHPGVDAGYHDYWARAIASGDWTPPREADPRILTTPYFKPPGYPFFLAAVYTLFGRSYLMPRVVQMLVGLGTCLLAFLFARRYFGDPIALIFAGLLAGYWVLIYFEAEFLEPVLLVFLSMLALYLLARLTERFAWNWALVSGLVLGSFAVVRSIILPFSIVALLWMLWISRGCNRRARLVTVSAFIIGMVLVILPVKVRNQLAGHDSVLISANGGINLYLGNNPAADGVSPNTPELEGWNSFDYPRIVDDLGRRLGRRMKYSDASRWYVQQATMYMRANPGRTLRLMGRKSLLFWGPVEIGNEKQDEYERLSSPVLRALPLTFPTILALALTGIGMLLSKRGAISQLIASDLSDRKGDRASRQVFTLILLFVLTYYVVHLPFFVTGRYRLPVASALMLPAALALYRLYIIATTRSAREFAVWSIAVVAIWGVVSRNWTGYQSSPGAWHVQRGVAWLKARCPDRAMREYEEALRVEPDSSRVHNNMAILLQQQGRISDAIREYGKALRIQPGLSAAFANMANLLEHLESGVRNEATASMLANGYRILGNAVMYQDRPDDAIAYYRKSLEFQPTNPQTDSDMAIACFFAGRFDEAWRYVELCRQNGGKLHPDFVTALEKAHLR